MNRAKADAEKKPPVICPRCGEQAVEVRTQYGIRSSCCGLWSFDRNPIVDKATHEARKEVYSMLKKMSEHIGPVELHKEVKKRTSVPELMVGSMNETTCKKVQRAMEDLLVDIISGDVKVIAKPKQPKGNPF